MACQTINPQLYKFYFWWNAWKTLIKNKYIRSQFCHRESALNSLYCYETIGFSALIEISFRYMTAIIIIIIKILTNLINNFMDHFYKKQASWTQTFFKSVKNQGSYKKCTFISKCANMFSLKKKILIQLTCCLLTWSIKLFFLSCLLLAPEGGFCRGEVYIEKEKVITQSIITPTELEQ